MAETYQAGDGLHPWIQQHPVGPSSPPLSGGGTEVQNVHNSCISAAKGINALWLRNPIG